MARWPHLSRGWAVGLGCTGVVLAGGYAAAAWAVSGRVPRDTTIAGVDVGGQHADGARQRLSGAFAASRSAFGGLAVSVAGRAAFVDPAAAGLDLDPSASLAQVTGFSLNPVTGWRHVAGGGAQEGLPRPDGERLAAELRRVAAGTDRPARDAGVTFEGGTARVRDAVVGSALDAAGAASAVRAGWLAGKRPLVLPVAVRQPQIGQDEAERALTEIAQPALDGVLEIAVGERSVELAPQRFVPALGLVQVDGRLQLAVDGTTLRAALLKHDHELGEAPRDARLVLRDRKPRIAPSRTGVTIDPPQLAAAAQRALGTPERTARVSAQTVRPKVSTKDIEKLGVKQRVTTFSTPVTPDALRTENLTIAARTVSGTVVKPGQTFSLNGVLGERTTAKGYHQAPAISGGRLVRDVGGGVSQMATTIFNNVFFAGLDDIYHKPHSFYISRYPEGREATVDWPTVDLKWRNDSPYAVLIEAHVGGGQVHVSFWSTRVWDVKTTRSGRSNFRTPNTVYDEGSGCVAQAPNGGFDVSVRRLFYKHGDLVKGETFSTSYIAEDRVVCGPKPKPASDS